VSSSSDFRTPAYIAEIERSVVEAEDLLPYSSLFMRHWKYEVLKHLAPVFEEVTVAGRDFQPLEFAIYSYAAAHLAHMQTKVVEIAHQTTKTIRYGPSEESLGQSLCNIPCRLCGS
jgi:hypothetical protein